MKYTIGYIGLGKMGLNMVQRLQHKNWDVVAYDKNSDAVQFIKELGITTVDSIEQMATRVEAPRLFWIMVPYKFVDSVLNDLKGYLQKGDIVIDGGNSPYKRSIERYNSLQEIGVSFLDVGVSGGPKGAKNGACLMVGGEYDVYSSIESLFKDLSIKDGYQYMGKAGAGHYVKMVHNGIEYGMMQAIAEGFNLMKGSDFDLNLENVASVYEHGSVIESQLISWLRMAYQEYGLNLDSISGEVSNSGEGKWTVETAKEQGAEVDIIEKSLMFREQSQGNPSYTGKVLSALRNQFGGHHVFTNDN